MTGSVAIAVGSLILIGGAMNRSEGRQRNMLRGLFLYVGGIVAMHACLPFSEYTGSETLHGATTYLVIIVLSVVTFRRLSHPLSSRRLSSSQRAYSNKRRCKSCPRNQRLSSCPLRSQRLDLVEFHSDARINHLLATAELAGIVEIRHVGQFVCIGQRTDDFFVDLITDVRLAFEATMSLKLAPGGMVIGAYGTPAYLSLTYLMNSRTRT